MSKLRKSSLLRILRSAQPSHFLISRLHQFLIQNLNWHQTKKTSWINAWKELVLMFATEDCWLNHISKIKTDQIAVLFQPQDSDQSLIIRSYGSQIENSILLTRDSRPEQQTKLTMLNSTTWWDFILGTENEKIKIDEKMNFWKNVSICRIRDKYKNKIYNIYI